MKKLCIYHGNCADGFGAAWVVWRAAGDHYDFHPGIYGEPAPDLSGRDVLLVDFSYPLTEMKSHLERARSITILDHHETTLAELSALLEDGRLKGRIDLEKSGTAITWDWFYPGTPLPPMLAHIDDGDLQRFALEGTREIQAAIFSLPYSFKVWDQLITEDMSKLRSMGSVLLDRQLIDLSALLETNTRILQLNGHWVPAAALPRNLAPLGADILAQNAPFGAGYFDTEANRVFSLRSKADGINVAEVAYRFGGGGHRHAAGFRIPKKDIPDFEKAGFLRLAAE
ncbi:MAG: DHHA1 domain-containing protein [Magnetospiraceae bacterium]